MKLQRVFQRGAMLLLVLCFCGCGLVGGSTPSPNESYGAPTSSPVAAVPTNAPPASRATMTPVVLDNTTGDQATAAPTPRRRRTSTSTKPKSTAKPQSTATDQASATSDTSDSSNSSDNNPSSARPIPGFKTVSTNTLPREARQTLALIDKGGPFPYRRDGIVFQNREGILPREPEGYYHEYTVITPGEQDRGARRIIAGSQGERFYTADHYNSFVQVLP